MTRISMILLVSALTALFAGCGGGSSSGKTDDLAALSGGAGSGTGTGGGTSGGGGGTPAPVIWRDLDSGQMSQVGTARQAVARTDAEYEALWFDHRGTLPPNQGKPPVDFTTEMVVAVFIGTRVSSGYSAVVTDVTGDDTGIVVTFEERYPGANCPPGLPVVISPYAFVAVSRISGSVAFSGSQVPVQCP